MCSPTREMIDNVATPSRRAISRGPSVSFPMKLHQMLSKAEERGYKNIICWLPGGKAFKIHDPEGMVSILSAHFNQTKYKSFLRQIQNYGFHRVTRGPKKGICSHKLFIQSEPHLCLSMKRVSKINGGRLSPSMASMVYQGHCLKTVKSAGSLCKQPTCEPVLLQPAMDTGNETFLEGEIIPSSRLNPFAELPLSQQQIHRDDDDDSWLNKLIDHQDVWMFPINQNVREFGDLDTMFEPNQVTFRTQF